MRSALRDAELPPPAGGWERLQRELGGAAQGPVAPVTKPRGSVWRIYWPRFAAAAAAVLICVVAGEFLLRPDKALVNDGTVIASAAEDGAAAVAIPQQAEPESVQDALAQAVGLPRERVAETTSVPARQTLLALTAAQPAEAVRQSAVSETDDAAAARLEADAAPEVSGEKAKDVSGEKAKPASKQASGQSAARSAAAGTARRSAFSDEPFVAYTKPRKTASFSDRKSVV